MSDIRHSIFKRNNSPNFYLEYTDPKTNKVALLSLRTRFRRQADQKAGAILQDIEKGEFNRKHRTEWKLFRKRYLTESTVGLKVKSVQDIISTLNRFEELCSPATVQSVDEVMIGQFKLEVLKELKQAERKKSKGEKIEGKTAGVTTLAKHLRNLKRMLRWASRQKLLAAVPHFDMPKGASTEAKGRAITQEEFDRMIDKVASVVGEEHSAEWRFFLRGLFLGGLRLEEALHLTWDYSEQNISVDLAGRYPMFFIPENADKSRKKRRLPMAPEFAALLLETVPESQRVGKVFQPTLRRQRNVEPTAGAIGRNTTRIAKAAGVKVSTEKSGSAHDLRRSFGTRWARKVKVDRLQIMMRHDDIQTTLRYYAQADAEEVAAELFALHDEEQTTVTPKQM